MASRDMLLPKGSLLLPFTSHQTSRMRLLASEYSSGIRRHSVLNEFSKKIKGKDDRNPEFKQSVKKLREKLTAEGAGAKQGSHTSPEEEQNQQSRASNASGSFFTKFKSTISNPNFFAAFQKLKEAKSANVAKEGYKIVEYVVSSNRTRRRRFLFTPSGETSTRTEHVVPSKQSWGSKKFNEFKEKVKGHPAYKRFVKYNELMTTKGGRVIIRDLRDLPLSYWTSDNQVNHKIQDGDNISWMVHLQCMEILQRYPGFSLVEFERKVQEAIKPVLNAYIKGDVETLEKYCSRELIERCKAEHSAYQSGGIFFDNKILRVSYAEVRHVNPKTPAIIVMFETQQIRRVRDRNGSITEGGKDTIHTVYYFWTLQQMDHEDLGEDALYLTWRLRDMQQLYISEPSEPLYEMF